MMKFLMGISAMAVLAGLALLGLALGSAFANGQALHEHSLFYPALCCLAAGVLNTMSIFLLDTKRTQA